MSNGWLTVTEVVLDEEIKDNVARDHRKWQHFLWHICVATMLAVIIWCTENTNQGCVHMNISEQFRYHT